MVQTEDLEARAARLYPDNPHLQAQWVRSIKELRAGRGWILDAGTVAPDLQRPEVLPAARLQASQA